MKIPLILFTLVTYICAQPATPFSTKIENNGEAPNRSVDILHYNITVSFDEAHKKVLGTTAITLSPLLPALNDITLDAEDMEFSSVTIGKKKLDFSLEPKKITVQLDKPYSYNDTFTVTFTYVSTPKKGIYFVQPDSANPDKPWQIWSQGEDMDNHHWFPCYDFPNDKATSEVTGTVRSEYVFLSNGSLVSKKENKKKGTTTYHWVEHKPHSSYLIMVAAGKYTILKDKVDGIPLEYYVYNDQVDDGKACLSVTSDIMHFYNQRTGYHYAWEKYAQIPIHDFMYGGMENTTATTMLDWELVTNARARIDNSPTSLIAHELAHQWWGDVVTCKDWRHMWLNESFASYFDPLYFEHAFGEDEFTNIMYGLQQSGIRSDKSRGRKPIVSVGSYTTNLYPRGASVLNMLRFVLGDDLFFRGLHYYITKYQFTPVETDDLKNALEECTGQNLYWFFDEWVYKAGYPVFDVSYTYNDTTKTIALRVRQTQKQDSLTGVFQMPVDIETVTSNGSATHRINILNADSVFTIAVPEKPMLVWFDKGNHLLKELHFTKSVDEWKYQAVHGSDVVARRIALEELADNGSQNGMLPLFTSIAKSDPFWSVREEAVKSIGKIKETSLEKTDALLAAMNDVKSNVRAQAASQLGSIHTAEVSAVLRQAIEKDSSYDVERNAITSLAKVDSTLALPVLLSKVDQWSYANRVSSAALNAIADLDSAKALEIALRKVVDASQDRGRYGAMRILRKYGKGNKKVIQTELSLVHDKSIQRWIVPALGDNADSNAIPVLETIANDDSNPAHDEAHRAIDKIKKRMGQ